MAEPRSSQDNSKQLMMLCYDNSVPVVIGDRIASTYETL